MVGGRAGRADWVWEGGVLVWGFSDIADWLGGSVVVGRYLIYVCSFCGICACGGVHKGVYSRVIQRKGKQVKHKRAVKVDRRQRVSICLVVVT